MPALTALTPVGARLTGFQVEALDETAVVRMQRLLADHGVLVLPDQDIDDDAFLRFLQSFGETMFTVGETPVPGYPQLNVITNVRRSERAPRSTFHTDTSYVRRPPAYTALRAVEVPQRGGHTLFTNQYTALATLPEALRDDLAARTITHIVTGLELDADQETSAVHPIVNVHPISHRTFLYLSTPERCAEVSGLTDERAAEMVGFLFAHSTRADNVYRHAWSAGDVVIWDNRCVLHRADHSDVVGDRVMHRGMVAASLA